jgi:hypothetical protein
MRKDASCADQLKGLDLDLLGRFIKVLGDDDRCYLAGIGKRIRPWRGARERTEARRWQEVGVMTVAGWRVCTWRDGEVCVECIIEVFQGCLL